MNLEAFLLGSLPLETNLIFCLRLLLACGCGAAIGAERSRHFKDAGIRTHLLVCAGATLIMLVSKYGFVDMALADGAHYPGTRGADPARVAAQVVSGISFLGAGVIFRREGLVRGLTTAAGIWITAGIGLSIGAGMAFVGLFVTVVVCILQILMHSFVIGPDSYASNHLHFSVKNGYDFHQTLSEQIDYWGATVQESSFSRNQEDGTTDYDLTVRRKEAISYSEMKEFVSAHEEIISCENIESRK